MDVERERGDTLKSSLPGLTPQVGLARPAAHKIAQLGQARVAMQSIIFHKKMDARFKPGHDASIAEYFG
jgi:hypothetical protein